MTDESSPKKWDVFISYSHIDNDEVPNWVDAFKDALQLKINSHWGKRAEIWKDQRLDGNQVLNPTILSTVKNSWLIVSVVSESYVTSDWCKDELRTFCEAARQNVGLSIDGMSRVFKVVKYPIDDPTQLGTIPELLDTTGDKFYVNNGRKDVPLNPARDNETFVDKVDDVAAAMAKVLKKIAGDRSAVPPTGISIFLAPATPDMAEQVESLRNALRQAGHTVVEIEPLYNADFEARLRAKLAQSHLSIHMIGNIWLPLADSPSGELLEAAAYRCANDEAAKGRPDFVRVTWRPPSAAAPQLPAKAAFVDRLRLDVGPGKENLVMSLEDLKGFVKSRVDKLLAPPEPAAPLPPPVMVPQHSAAPWVYIAYNREVDGAQDSAGAAVIQKIDDYLFDKGFDVKRVPADATPTECAQYHDMMIGRCEGVLLFSEGGGRAWLDMQLAELSRRRSGYGGCVVLTAPGGYRSHDVAVIAMADPFDPATLAAYADSLHALTGVAR